MSRYIYATRVPYGIIYREMIAVAGQNNAILVADAASGNTPVVRHRMLVIHHHATTIECSSEEYLSSPTLYLRSAARDFIDGSFADERQCLPDSAVDDTTACGVAGMLGRRAILRLLGTTMF